MNRFNEGDDELEVDVEQCSDSEALSRSRTPQTTSNNSRGTTPSPSDDERLTPEPVSDFNQNYPIKISNQPSQSKPKIVGSCNCDELRPIQCHLETKELWDKFNDLGTEMIITKTGR